MVRIFVTVLNVILLGLSLAHAQETMLYTTYLSAAYKNQKSNQIDGPVSFLVKQINLKLNQEIKLEIVPIPRMFLKLEDHETHAAFNMSYTQERQKKWYYSRPVNTVRYGVFVQNNNHLVYENRSQMEDYTIITYGPTNLSKKTKAFAAQIKGTEVIVENRYEGAFKVLNAGRYGFKSLVYGPDIVGFDTIKKYQLNNIRYAGDDTKNNYYVVFDKQRVSRAYVDQFNVELLELFNSGEMEKIYSKYKSAEVNAQVPSRDDMITELN